MLGGMFKKQQRLTRPEFTHYFACGQRHHFTHYTILTAPLRGGGAPYQVAVVVGKKVAKRAVRRNRLRRRVYAVTRAVLASTDFTGAMVILIKPAFASLPRRQADTILGKSIADIAKSA